MGTSGFFAGTDVSIDTGGKILSAGTDLLDIFQDTNLASLTNGSCINSFTYDGDSAATVCIETAAYTSWDYAGTNITNAVSSIDLNGQGAFTFDKVANVGGSIDLGLQEADSPTFAGLTLNGQIDMTANKITCLGTPTDGEDAANKAYVDATGAGTVCSVTAGTGIIIGGTSTDPTVNLALSGLSTSTSDADGDFFAVVDSANAQKKLTKANINISGFNNDSNFTTCTGTVSSIATGTGIGGGTITGSGTLTVGAGTGLCATADGLCVATACNTAWNAKTTCTGTVTSVTGGDGLTGTVTSSGSLNVGAGTAITVAADTVGVTSSCNTAWNAKTTCTGTVTNIQTGNGITGGTITGTGTLEVTAGTGLTQTSTGLCVAGTCDTKWSSTYTSYNSVSANIVCNVSSSGVQGNLSETQLGSASATIDLGLCTGDSPTFAGVTGGCVQVGVADDCTVTTASGNLTIDSAGGTVKVDDNLCVTGDIDFDGTATGDGSGLTGVTATPSFPTTAKTNLASTDKLFINDNASCQTSGNKHVTYLNLLTDIAGGVGTGLTVTSGNDSICLKNATSLAANTVVYWDDTNGQLANSIITRTGSKITVGGDHLVTGSSTVYGNLSVTGDFTCVETTVSTTSALSVTNTGTGPALFVSQGGTQPIAHFIDQNGDDIVFADDGKLGIGTFTPSEKLDVVGNITASGTLTIDGSTTLGNAGADTTTINGTCIITPNLDTVTGCSLVVKNSDDTLGTDDLTTSNQTALFGSNNLATVTGACDNAVAVFCGTTGLIESGSITDTGSLITLGTDTKVDSNKSLDIYATGGSVHSSEKTFTASVGTGGTTVATFAKSGFRTGKYIVSLIKGVNRTSFEILVTYNDTASFGTVYGIVDAQATSQLASVDVTNTGSTIDLVITSASATTTAIVHGKAFY